MATKNIHLTIKENICGNCHYRRKCNRHSVCGRNYNKVVGYFNTCEKHLRISETKK